MTVPLRIFFLFLSDEGPMLETLDYTIRMGSTPTFLYFDLYLYSAYAAHYVYFNNVMIVRFRRMLRLRQFCSVECDVSSDSEECDVSSTP